MNNNSHNINNDTNSNICIVIIIIHNVIVVVVIIIIVITIKCIINFCPAQSRSSLKYSEYFSGKLAMRETSCRGNLSQ